MRELSWHGFVWLDNMHDNFGFLRVGDEDDKWALVVLDPGGILPEKGLDPKLASAL